MPVHQSVYLINDSLQQLTPTSLDSERQLEDLIVANPAVLHESWMLIGRQVMTDHGKYIDLLALDPAGNVIIIELKKDKTPREVVAQAIDYASWVQNLSADRIAAIYHKWTDGGNLANGFRDFFGCEMDEESLNDSHQMVIVATALDASSERIVNYLNDTAGIALSVLFFTVLTDGTQRFLSRAWLSEPQEVEATQSGTRNRKDSGSKEPWNGEFYVSFGGSSDPAQTGRLWPNAERFGFISGGGKPWFSKTLFQLQEGDRVWVNIPGTGYVGVGHVTETAQRVSDFQVDGAPILDHPDFLGNWSYQMDLDDDHAEYAVRVTWIHTVSESEAVREVGFFGNQNTVAKPASSKWIHTINRLKDLWGIDR